MTNVDGCKNLLRLLKEWDFYIVENFRVLSSISFKIKRCHFRLYGFEWGYWASIFRPNSSIKSIYIVGVRFTGRHNSWQVVWIWHHHLLSSEKRQNKKKFQRKVSSLPVSVNKDLKCLCLLSLKYLDFDRSYITLSHGCPWWGPTVY